MSPYKLVLLVFRLPLARAVLTSVVLSSLASVAAGGGLVAPTAWYMATAAAAAFIAMLTHAPCYTTAHLFVDNSNLFVPLSTAGKRVNYDKLRDHLLLHRARPGDFPALSLWAVLGKVVATCSPQRALTLLTRRRGVMYLVGSVPPALDAVWQYARGAGFTVLTLPRVPRAPTRGSSGTTRGRVPMREEGVDDDLHKNMANAIIDSSGMAWRLLRACGLQPRPVMVQLSGDGNDNNGRGGFPDQVRRALTAGLHVEVHAWHASMHGNYRAMVLEQSPRSAARMAVFDLDPYEADFTFKVSKHKGGKHAAATTQAQGVTWPRMQPQANDRGRYDQHASYSGNRSYRRRHANSRAEPDTSGNAEKYDESWTRWR